MNDSNIMMQKLFLPLFISVLTLLAGCATSSNVQKEYRVAQGETFKLQVTAPTATEQGLNILRDRLVAQLSSNRLLATALDTPTRTLEVNVTNYVMRHGASRAMLGLFAGSDNVQSTVRVKDLTTGSTLAEFAVESKNFSAWGTSGGLLEDHADEIVATLRGVKK
ncbi:MAG: DUF4410 domain-containing protein [Thiobacillus sp.]